MKHLVTAVALAVTLPAAADAQRDVTRRSYTFLEDRLVIEVLAEAPGELQVVRGQRGLVEVAARSRDGFAGFGLGGDYTRLLRLTAVGSDAVQYLVVVPEHVAVSVVLPRGGTAHVPDRDGLASYRWGEDATRHGETRSGDAADARVMDIEPIMPTTSAGLYVVHSGRGRVPSLVDVPELASVRSMSVRVEGDDFRVAATRPLALTPGDAGHMVIRVDGEPLDLVLFVPRGSSGFELRSGSRRIADVAFGRPRSYCGNTVVQQPTPHQDWLTVFPSDGSVSCR
ncbi:MAG TPA: hypothetical protein VK912_09780 [Longimicrobiales bacterium]|nr:hypothetical protein [Longimicrobiales bacterium]